MEIFRRLQTSIFVLLALLEFTSSLYYSSRRVEKVVYVSPNVIESEKRILLDNHHDYSVQLKLDNERSIGLTREYIVSIIPGKYANRSLGIMAVVQKLNLRLNELEGEDLTNDRCRDYIEFISQDDTQVSSGKICGYLPSEDRGNNNSKLIGERSFHSEHPALGIRVHVDDSTFEDNNKNDSLLLTAEIVFTVYIKVCNDTKGLHMKPCRAADNSTCISQNLFCNGRIDCGLETDFAYDEMNCYYCSECAFGALVAGIILIAVLIVILKMKTQIRLDIKNVLRTAR